MWPVLSLRAGPLLGNPLGGPLSGVPALHHFLGNGEAGKKLRSIPKTLAQSTPFRTDLYGAYT